MRAFLFLLLFAVPAQAQAQDYPTRTVEIVVPFAAGGGTDLIARVLIERAHRGNEDADLFFGPDEEEDGGADCDQGHRAERQSQRS